MLHTIPLLGALAVVEAVNRAHQIAGDAADTFKPDAFAHHLHTFLLEYRGVALGRDVFCVPISSSSMLKNYRVMLGVTSREEARSSGGR